MSLLSVHPTIDEVHSLYKGGTKVTEVIEFLFERIKKVDKKYEAFVRLHQEYSLNQAQVLDNLLTQTDISTLIRSKPLFGIPFALKDNVLVEGLESRSASKILEGFLAPYSADIYNNLIEAGGVLIGQVNMDEFAFGSSTEHSSYNQKTKNPYDIDAVPGGSSGGSAVAVAAGCAVFAIGSDTGGSVRQPASFCGLVGLRPTYGLLSRYGIMAAASSFDQPGIFTNNIQDNVHVLEVLQKKTTHDAKALNIEQNYNLDTSKKKIKIGLPKEYFEGLEDDVAKKMQEAMDAIATQVEFVYISLPMTQYNVATYYILMAVESASNLERYDGIRYGKQLNKELFYPTRGELFGDEAKRRILLGTYASSAGYYDAYYNTAAKVRLEIKREFNEAFKNVDLIITPTSPFTAFKFGSKSDPISMYLADIMTLSPAIAQNSSLNVPIGKVNKNGNLMPVGLQIVGSELAEQEVYNLGYLIQQKLDYVSKN